MKNLALGSNYSIPQKTVDTLCTNVQFENVYNQVKLLSETDQERAGWFRAKLVDLADQ